MNQLSSSSTGIMRRVLFLGMASILLCHSLILSVFTPAPLIVNMIQHGRRVAIATLVGCGFISYFISTLYFGDTALFIYFVLSALCSVLLFEFINRSFSPMKTIVATSASLFFVLLMGFGLVTSSMEGTVKDQVIFKINENREVFDQQIEALKKSENSEGMLETLNLLNDSEKLAQYFLENIPSMILTYILVMVWINLFFGYKANRALNLHKDLKYTEVNLIHIKVADQMIWPVIAILAVAVFGEDIGLASYQIYAMSLLKVIGVLYFFQGFGIYISFLNFVGIYGFLRTLLIVFTVFTASQILAAVGLFDMFINFRKFLIRNNKE